MTHLKWSPLLLPSPNRNQSASQSITVILHTHTHVHNAKSRLCAQHVRVLGIPKLYWGPQGGQGAGFLQHKCAAAPPVLNCPIGKWGRGEKFAQPALVLITTILTCAFHCCCWRHCQMSRHSFWQANTHTYIYKCTHTHALLTFFVSLNMSFSLFRLEMPLHLNLFLPFYLLLSASLLWHLFCTCCLCRIASSFCAHSVHVLGEKL